MIDGRLPAEALGGLEAPRDGMPPAVGALAEPVRPVGPRFIALLSVANLGLWAAFFTPIQVLLPNQLQEIDPAGKIAALSIVTGAGAFVAVVANPVAGALSDRTVLRFGRRHPWTIGCALAGALALVGLSQATTVLAVLVGWCLAQACFNGMLASVTALVPDQVPVRQRGAVSAYVGIPQPLGLVIGTALVTTLFVGVASGYLAIAVFVAIAAVPLVLFVRDEPLPRALRPAFDLREFLAGFWIDPRHHPDFGWAWITRFLVGLGNALGTLYLLYFLRDAVHYEERYGGKAEDALLLLILVYTGCLLVTAIVGGILSDRAGRRKAFVMVATGVMAVGAAVLAVSQTWEAAIAAAAIMGAGYGTYLSVDAALITQVLPSAASRAKDLGIINIANSLPQVLAPALAGPVIAVLGGYPALYVLTAGVTLLGAVLVQPIRGVR